MTATTAEDARLRQLADMAADGDDAAAGDLALEYPAGAPRPMLRHVDASPAHVQRADRALWAAHEMHERARL